MSSIVLPETVKGRAFSVTAVKSGASLDEDKLERGRKS
jgi:hypothetical protein